LSGHTECTQHIKRERKTLVGKKKGWKAQRKGEDEVKINK
jgi:hypothetical protein